MATAEEVADDLTAHPASAPCAEVSPLDEVYPPQLRCEEGKQVDARRCKAGVDPGAPRVGVALSGGGIRSATFSLGLFQALARQRLIGKVDFLSTVSGGGYFGSFLGGLFLRPQSATVGSVEASLVNPSSWPVRWLRENGRYLSPNGAGDAWMAAAILLRNWVALHVVVLTLLFTFLSSAALLQMILCPGWPDPGLSGDTNMWIPTLPFGIWGSPFLILPAATFLFLMVPFGVFYWLTQLSAVMAALTKVFHRLRGHTATEQRDLVRNWLSHGLSVSLVITLVSLAFALVESVGQTCYVQWALHHFSAPWGWAGASAVGMAVFVAAQQLFNLLDKLPQRRTFKMPLDLIALLLGVAWVGLILVSLSVLTHYLAWRSHLPWEMKSRLPSILLLLGVTLITGFLNRVFSCSFGFVNLSSHQQLYAARLKRAYLGASNPERQAAKNYNITNPLPGDDIPTDQYTPHASGGPLHLINVTLNETVSGKSQVEQRDRRGLSMAFGPCGLSVGLKDHGIWGQHKDEIHPLPRRSGNVYQSLAGATLQPHHIECLGIASWIAISGAAFTTGMGLHTRMGLSLLLGLANVRLGYWWDSYVDPSKRPGRTDPTFAGRVGEVIGTWLPVQSCLLDELLGRFHGPARQQWYLTDGGHFENTGGYELIRRRVPLIIVSDAGCDPAYQFEDVAGLVRKARIDFNADIEFLKHRPNSTKSQAASSNGLPYLEDLLDPKLLDVIGALEDFASPSTVAEAPASGTKYPRKHAIMARVSYAGTDQVSWVILIKPCLTGDEPVDLLEYQQEQPDFPQESTVDQFFDEAQWESYRKLGEHIGSLLFAQPTGTATTTAAWYPGEMCPPCLVPPTNRSNDGVYPPPDKHRAIPGAGWSPAGRVVLLAGAVGSSGTVSAADPVSLFMPCAPDYRLIVGNVAPASIRYHFSPYGTRSPNFWHTCAKGIPAANGTPSTFPSRCKATGRRSSRLTQTAPESPSRLNWHVLGTSGGSLTTISPLASMSSTQPSVTPVPTPAFTSRMPTTASIGWPTLPIPRISSR